MRVCDCVCVCEQDARGKADADSWAAAECIKNESSCAFWRMIWRDKKNAVAMRCTRTHRHTNTHAHAHAQYDCKYIYMCMRLFWIPDTRFNSKIFIFIIQPRRSSLRCDGARFTAATNSALRAAAITAAAHALVVFCCRSAAASQRRRSKYFVSHTA